MVKVNLNEFYIVCVSVCVCLCVYVKLCVYIFYRTLFAREGGLFPSPPPLLSPCYQTRFP
jgi:hypothetical protein